MFCKPVKGLLSVLSLFVLGEMCHGEFWEYQGPQSREQCRQSRCSKSCSCLLFKPKNCLDILHNGCNVDGIYKVFPEYESINFRRGIDVYCDQSTEGGGWVVFQRRINGSVNFDRSWIEFKYGFGNLDGEFWLGNEILHMMAHSSIHNTLRVEMETTENATLHANYRTFVVNSENHHYSMMAKKYRGDAGPGDLFYSSHSTPFSTDDKDNSHADYPHKFGGGWWYSHNHPNDLNGKLDFIQNHYLTWAKDGPKLKRTELKFRWTDGLH